MTDPELNFKPTEQVMGVVFDSQPSVVAEVQGNQIQSVFVGDEHAARGGALRVHPLISVERLHDVEEAPQITGT